MRSFEATSTIRATPQAIWRVLVDGGNYARWHSGVDAVDGTIAPCATVTVRSKAAPAKGVRTFALAPERDGSTRFIVREEYTGPLLPMICRSMPDLGPSFSVFANGRRARAERP